MSPTSFRVEYRRSGGTSMFSRNVKFQVDIAPAHGEGGDGHKMHCINFTLLSGKHYEAEHGQLGLAFLSP